MLCTSSSRGICLIKGRYMGVHSLLTVLLLILMMQAKKETWISLRKIQTIIKFKNTDNLSTSKWSKTYLGKAKPTLVKRPPTLCSSINLTKRSHRSSMFKLKSTMRPTLDKFSTSTWSRISSIRKYTPITLERNITTWKMWSWRKRIWSLIHVYSQIFRSSVQTSSRLLYFNAL